MSGLDRCRRRGFHHMIVLGEDPLDFRAFVKNHPRDATGHSAFVSDPAQYTCKVFESCAFGTAMKCALGVAVGSAFAGHNHSPSMFAVSFNAHFPLELHLGNSIRRKNLRETGNILCEARMFACPCIAI